MSSDRTPETLEVAQRVEEYVDSELGDSEKYSNRSPLDELGIWSLHVLAAEIFALGWREGERVASERKRRVIQRDRDARKTEGS